MMFSKIALCVVSLCLGTGCQSRQAVTEDHSYTQDTAQVEYYNSLKAPAWTIEEGIGMDAYVLSSDAEHSMSSRILQQEEAATISFWLKPQLNLPGTPILSLVNAQGEIMKLTAMTQQEDRQQGMALQMKADGSEQWLLGNLEFTLNTYRYNYIVLVFSGSQATVYLNGQQAFSGDLGQPLSAIESSWLVVGKDGVNYGQCMEGTFQDLKIRSTALSGDAVWEEYRLFYPEVLLDELTLPDLDDLQEDLVLYPELGNEFPAVWTSDNPELIRIENNRGIVRVPEGEQDQTVTLSVSAEVEGRHYERDFTAVVRADTPQTRVDRDFNALQRELGAWLNAQTPLPQSGEYGSQIDWQVTSGEVMIRDHSLIKTNPDQERTPAVLTATIHQQQVSRTLQWEGIVLDRFEAYILSYFNGDLGEESGKLAYSTDGLHWTALNDGQPVLTSSLGTGRVRDPFIGRDKNGDFIITATEGYDNPSIYLWRSRDLIDLSNHSLQRIAWYDNGLNSSGQRAWAPEVVYDRESGQYSILFSDTLREKSGAIFAVTTPDFQTFSYPRALFQPGYAVIDGTLMQAEGRYWLLYKDEREAAQTLFYASASSLSDGFVRRYDEQFLCRQKYIEGPFVLPPLNATDPFILYVDHYPQQQFLAARFTRLGENPDFSWLDESEFHLPEQDVRHGSAIAVTAKELDRILAAY